MSQAANNEALEKRYQELCRDAKDNGYNINPDKNFTAGLVEGLLINAGRYGYESCPCRLSRGDKQ